ncbi:MAG: hypothetical protein J4F46_01175 [Dehalococcoidia bacterium]|nr:hypothetical protein [Dehalococcoidia bacterium]
MGDEKAREIATTKLIDVYNDASIGSKRELEAIRALGKIGTERAARKLADIYSDASSGSEKGEIGQNPRYG